MINIINTKINMYKLVAQNFQYSVTFYPLDKHSN